MPTPATSSRACSASICSSMRLRSTRSCSSRSAVIMSNNCFARLHGTQGTPSQSGATRRHGSLSSKSPGEGGQSGSLGLSRDLSDVRFILGPNSAHTASTSRGGTFRLLATHAKGKAGGRQEAGSPAFRVPGRLAVSSDAVALPSLYRRLRASSGTPVPKEVVPRTGTSMTSRRILIVAGWILAGLFGLAGVANLALGQAVSIVAGISALTLGATAAVTLWLFIAAGGWTRDEPPIADSDQRVRVAERAREPHERRTFRQPPSAQGRGRGASDMSPVGEAGKTHLGTPVFPSARRDS